MSALDCCPTVPKYVRFSGRAEGRSSVIRQVRPDSEKFNRILGRARVCQNTVHC